nr:lytic transglycosylase domain-containing protein [Hyphomicrobium sp.]
MQLSLNSGTRISCFPRVSRSLPLTLFLLGATLAGVPTAAESALKPVPAPQLLPSEKAHESKLESALSPLLSLTPAAEDLSALRDAASAIRSKNLDDLAAAKARINDPIGRTLVVWMRLRAGLGDPQEFRDFLRDHPDWPDRP